MDIIILMNHNSYVGREYLKGLRGNDIKVDVCCIGCYPEIDLIAQKSCGKDWIPESQASLESFHDFYYFTSLKSSKLLSFLTKNKYEIGIQGGTGIIKNIIINKFKLGILNFHPGLLPSYRGCSAPEWQLFEGNEIYSTCHLIDEGIDSGKILKIKKLKVNFTNYSKFRSSIYPLTAIFLIEVIKNLIVHNGFKKRPYEQEKKKARYLKYIGDEKINLIKENWLNYVKILNN